MGLSSVKRMRLGQIYILTEGGYFAESRCKGLLDALNLDRNVEVKVKRGINWWAPAEKAKSGITRDRNSRGRGRRFVKVALLWAFFFLLIWVLVWVA